MKAGNSEAVLEEIQHVREEILEVRTELAWLVKNIRLLGAHYQSNDIGTIRRNIFAPFSGNSESARKISNLTRKELEALKLLAQGMSTVEIANTLNLNKDVLSRRMMRISGILECKDKINMAVMFERERLESAKTIEDILAPEYSRAGFGRKEVEWGIKQFVKLSPRELRVIEQIAKGLGNEDIAEILGVHSDTVVRANRNLRRKLGCRNRVEVAIIYLRKKTMHIMLEKTT